MPRALLYTAFFAVAGLLLFGSHWYLHRQFVRLPDWNAPWRQLATATIAGMGVLAVASFALARFAEAPWMRGLAWVGYIWLGLLFLLLLGGFGVDVARWTAKLIGSLIGIDAHDPERRLFLARLAGGGLALSAVAAGSVAVRTATQGPRLEPVTVPLRRLPKGLDGFRIVQWSDVHVGPTIRRGFVEDLVRRTNALEPDLVVITGDLVDGPVELLRSETAPIANLRARHGVYFVTGNHEYFSGADAWVAELQRLGVRVLQNEHVTIATPQGSFDLAGVHDHTAARLHPHHATDIAKAVAGRDPDRELVLLAHQPRAVDAAHAAGAGLVLSGHTHGGQIWPFGFLVRFAQPYVEGLHDHDGTWIYVSRGTGWWGPPMRLGSPSELTAITLKTAEV
jgi:predicted MPP superfamily phosphohydrolase